MHGFRFFIEAREDHVVARMMTQARIIDFFEVPGICQDCHRVPLLKAALGVLPGSLQAGSFSWNDPNATPFQILLQCSHSGGNLEWLGRWWSIKKAPLIVKNLRGAVAVEFEQSVQCNIVAGIVFTFAEGNVQCDLFHGFLEWR